MTIDNELKDEIKHLRQAAKTSCDSHIGRMTRQALNRQADKKQARLELIETVRLSLDGLEKFHTYLLRL